MSWHACVAWLVARQSAIHASYVQVAGCEAASVLEPPYLLMHGMNGDKLATIRVVHSCQLKAAATCSAAASLQAAGGGQGIMY